MADLQDKLRIASRQAAHSELEKQEALVRLRYVENFKATADARRRDGDLRIGTEPVDPFARFTEAQAVAVASRLSSVDRHILEFMKGFNSESGRRGVLIYAAVLHGIVYASLISRLVHRQ